jgi:hypothetical protein
MGNEDLNFEVGKEVIVYLSGRGYGGSVEIARHTIERITKTTVILDSKSRFDRTDGRAQSKYSSEYILLATEDNVRKWKERIEKRDLAKLIDSIKWDQQSLGNLREIKKQLVSLNIVKKEETKNETQID